MKQILFIGIGAPWFKGQGYLIRQNMLLQALTKVAQVHLVMFDCPDSRCPLLNVESLTRLSIPIRAEQRSQGKLKGLIADVFNLLPRRYRYRSLNSVQEHISKLEPDRFDAVFVYHIDLAFFTGPIKHRCLIIDVDDPESLRQQGRLHSIGGTIDWRTALDRRKLKWLEYDIIKQARVSFVCNHSDALYFGKLSTIRILPNTVTIPEKTIRQLSPIPVLLFVGIMTDDDMIGVNTSGIKWFLQFVWPGILLSYPNCHLWIVGKTSQVIQQYLSEFTNVVTHGFVDDLSPYYSKSWASIAPIIYGTGTRIKILESFAYSCPVISTPKGCEGIDVIPNQNILVGETPQEFTQACLSLISDQQLRDRLGQAGYALATSKYSREYGIRTTIDSIQNFL